MANKADGQMDWGKITAFNKSRDLMLEKLGETARAAGFPVVREDMAAFLEFICSVKKPKRILEIGCCIGYSAILMARSSPSLEKLTTIDRYDYMIERAQKNISDFKLGDSIELLEGDAALLLREMTEGYDLIFLDAAKGQYPAFLPHCRRLLNSGGVFIADNIFFNGKVNGDSEFHHRDKTIINRMHEFLTELFGIPEFQSAVLPVGDGITVSCRL